MSIFVTFCYICNILLYFSLFVIFVTFCYICNILLYFSLFYPPYKWN